MLRKSPGNEVVVGLFSLLISNIINMVLLFFHFKLKMAVHAACTKKKNM